MPQIALFEYQAEWPAHFRLCAAELKAALGLGSAHLEHIGSTSIVGLCAKPVIDIMLGVAFLSEVESRIAALKTLGYIYRPEYETELPDRRYFVRLPTAIPRVHLHAVVHGSKSWVRHLAFRNALRADTKLARAYASLKYELAARHANDKAAYTEAKGPFIERVLAAQKPDPQIQYRKPTEIDSPQMVGVHYAAVQVLARSHYGTEVLSAWSPAPNEARYQWLAGILSQDGVLCTVATLPNLQIVGFFIVAPEQSLLRAIYVHPDHAGCGIGRGLLQRAEAQCKERGVTSLWLNASYNAQAFYANCGYEAVGPTIYPLSDEVSMGAIRMVKHLDP